MTDDLRRDLRKLPPRSLTVPEDLYERVIATARRRRRARWAGFTTVALAVAGALVAVAVNAGASPGSARLVPVTPASSAPTQTPPSPAPSTAATSAATGPGFVPVSVSFVSSEVGWAYGPRFPLNSQGSGPFVGELAVTHDGGQHWAMLPAPGVNYSAEGGASSIRFVDSNRGYLYGDGLFETTDGGLHWRRLTAPGPVTQLAAAGTHLYVMAVTCPASAPFCGISDLYTGGLDGRDLVRVDAVPETTQAQFATSGAHIYLLSSVVGSTIPAGPVPATISTSIDGTHWSTFRTPCDAFHPDYGAVAPFSEDGLALVCGGQADAGMQPKTAYISTDGGANWTPRGSAFPAGGYVAALGAADENTWVLAEQRGTLLVTHDGGSTWREAAIQGLTQGVDGWTQVVFPDPQHAVAVPDGLYADGLVITGDAGNSWSAVPFSP